MSSYNTTELTISGYTQVNAGYKVVEDSGLRLRRQIVDIAKLIAWHTKNVSTITLIAQNDLIAAVPVFKGEFVKRVFARVIKASTASSTISVGDAVSGLPAASATGWISTFASQTATQTTATPPVLQNGGVISPDTLSAYLFAAAGTSHSGTELVGLGKMYYADGSIDLKLIGATSIVDGIYEVIVEYLPLTLGVAN